MPSAVTAPATTGQAAWTTRRSRLAGRARSTREGREGAMLRECAGTVARRQGRIGRSGGTKVPARLVPRDYVAGEAAGLRPGPVGPTASTGSTSSTRATRSRRPVGSEGVVEPERAVGLASAGVDGAPGPQ